MHPATHHCVQQAMTEWKTLNILGKQIVSLSLESGSNVEKY
jgi:hypothetical protein